MIAGIVLAAGRSRRMGAPKALLSWQGRSLLAHALTALREGGCAEVRVVVGPETDAAAREIAAAARGLGACALHNPDAAAEQVGSLCLALRTLPAECAAAVVLPVDVPRVRAATVAALGAAFRAGAPLAIPVHAGRRGHPALFARPLFAELCAPGLPEGARSVIAAHAHAVREVAVADAGVLLDVDTPADVERLHRLPGP